jgi:hypothetical protein
MKHPKLSEDQKQMLAGGCGLTAAEELQQSEIDFAPASDELHRLAAETELNAERSPGRVHEFRNPK